MARGGSREGAGRKAGAVTRKTREIADKASEQGITPLEVMLSTMRDMWAQAGQAEDPTQRMALKVQAAEVAQKAAPFVHAKLANVQVAGDPDGSPIRIARVELVPLSDDSPHSPSA